VVNRDFTQCDYSAGRRQNVQADFGGKNRGSRLAADMISGFVNWM
jgi:hypothetical protein